MIKAKHKYAWVRYHPKGSNHEHMVILGDGKILLTEIEEAAEELAESVMLCNEDRHKGRGIEHGQEEAEKAFKAAVEQIQTVDFDEYWEEIQRQIRVYKKWGGPPPAAVMLPSFDDPKKWEVMIPDSEGTPYMYDMDQKVLGDIVPYPQDLGARPNKQGIGWNVDKRRKYRK